VQPKNDGQARGEVSNSNLKQLSTGVNLRQLGSPFKDKVGLGEPTENPYILLPLRPLRSLIVVEAFPQHCCAALFQVPFASEASGKGLYTWRVRPTGQSCFIQPMTTTRRRFLQFGSPHGLGSQAQYIAAAQSEVWVNVGYRLSAFGFLACDKPRLSGNYGFKDQWLALEWVKANIAVFGGLFQGAIITDIVIEMMSCRRSGRCSSSGALRGSASLTMN
jgi:hypothetical protein